MICAEPECMEVSELLAEAWSFCKRQSKSIEVFYKNMDGDKILTRVDFPFDPDVSVYPPPHAHACVHAHDHACVSMTTCVYAA